MDMYIQRSHDAELRELCAGPAAIAVDLHELHNPPGTPTVSCPSPVHMCDAKSLCAWLARSMPPLPWSDSDAGRDHDFQAFFPRRPPPLLKDWVPPLKDGYRHPDDHIIVKPPRSPL